MSRHEGGWEHSCRGLGVRLVSCIHAVRGAGLITVAIQDGLQRNSKIAMALCCVVVCCHLADLAGTRRLAARKTERCTSASRSDLAELLLFQSEKMSTQAAGGGQVQYVVLNL